MDLSDATRIVAPQHAHDDDPDRTVVRRSLGAPPGAAQPRPGSASGAAQPRPASASGAAQPRPASASAAAQPRSKATPVAMPAGTRLHEYRIESVLGQGGFGITYLATDVHLSAQVAIKEYLPEEIALRRPDGHVAPRATRHVERYLRGLESFLAEARTLAALRHPAIVRVARFFEANRTAYMVLEYEQGTPLKAWWPQHHAVGETGLVERLLPVLDGLEAVHAAGFLHRDVKPENIQVREPDGHLVLLDFGSAAQVAAATDPDAVVVTPGYAPIEQYGAGEQGPWTDLYALGATLYWCVTGKRVPDAETRQHDPQAYVPVGAAALARTWGPSFLRAIDWALAMDPALRPCDVASFRRMLCADHVNSLDLHEALQQGDGDDVTTMAAARAGGGARTGASVPTSPTSATGTTGRTAARRGPLRRAVARTVTPRDWPLAVKLAVLLVGTALLPMLLAGVWNLRGGTAALERAELENVEQLARGSAARVGQFIDDARHTARGLASDLSFAAFLAQPDAVQAGVLQQRLKAFVRGDPDLQLVIVMDQKGQALLSNDPEVAGRNFAFRRYFREAAAGRSYTSGIIVGAVAGATGFFVAEPIHAPDGTQLGVLVVRVLGSAVSRIVGELEENAELTPMLVDGDGVVLHHPKREHLFKSLDVLSEQQQSEIKADQRFRRERVESLGEAALARTLLSARVPGHRSVVAGGDVRTIVGYAPVPGHDWKVAITETHESFEAPVRELWHDLLLTMAVVGAACTALALALARGIVRPIRDLIASAHALKAGDYDRARVAVTSRDEVGQLARTFNVMVDVLRQRERERRIGR